MEKHTIAYYDTYVDEFTADTLHASMSELLGRFLTYVPIGRSVLDWGCGTGRDAKAMLEAGYRVVATDASIKMCEVAQSVTGLNILHEEFIELHEHETFDGIWASASLLHVAAAELPQVFLLAADALKQDGVFYCSFKYGTFEGMRGSRFYTDMNECSMKKLVAQIPDLYLDRMWISNDVRPSHAPQRWLNCFLMKR